MARRQGLLEEALGLLGIARDDSRQERLGRHEPPEPLDALGVRQGDERAFAFHVERVEEEGRERQRAAGGVDVLASAEAAHRLLEGARPPVRAQRERLALDDGLAHRERARPLHHLGHARRHVLQLPGEDAHLVPRPVDLQPRAVQLVLEGRLAESLERLLGVAGRARQHRRHRREEAQRETAEAGRPLLGAPRGPALRGPARTSRPLARRRRRGPMPARSPRSRGRRAPPGAPRRAAARPAGAAPLRPWTRAAARSDRRRRSVEPAPVSAATPDKASSTRSSVRGAPTAGPEGIAGSSVFQPIPMRPCGSVPVR